MLDKLSDGKLLLVEERKNQKSMQGDKHYHNAFELYFMESGSCKYFIDNKVYAVQEGDLILIPEGTLHKTAYEGHNARTLIYCSRHYIPAEAVERLPSILHLYRNPAALPRLRALIENIKQEFWRADEFSETILVSQLHLLFYTLIREMNTREAVHTEPSYVSGAISYIKAHYTDGATLKQAARAIGVTPEHLSRAFKKETGLGFCEYLTLLRLQKAEELLRSDAALSVTQAAFACGFNDANYFSKRFKDLYGVSPVAFRKQKEKR